MPELAEIETVRRYIEKETKGLKIKDIVVEETDRFLFQFAKVADVRKALIGRRIKGTGRKGKYFWLELDKKPWPIFHLGMSGNIAILKSPKKGIYEKAWGGEEHHKGDDGRRLWFCRILLKLEKGVEIGLTDPRRFGRMWLAAGDVLEHPRIKQLGFDPMIDFPSAVELGQILSRRKSAIKAVLLDQSLFAGVGNWLADEILYQARLSPHRPASGLSATEVCELRKQTLAVVKKAVAVKADYEKFPKTWLFHHRWGKVAGSSTSRKHKIVHETVGGRTTAWSPVWQR